MTLLVLGTYCVVNAILESIDQRTEKRLQTALEQAQMYAPLQQSMRDQKIIRFGLGALTYGFLFFAWWISEDATKERTFYVLIAFALAVFIGNVGWSRWAAAKMGGLLNTNEAMQARKTMLVTAGLRLIAIGLMAFYVFRYMRFGWGRY